MEHRALIAELEQAVAPELEALSHFLYTHPELGMEERQAVRCLSVRVRRQSHAAAEEGTEGE